MGSHDTAICCDSQFDSIYPSPGKNSDFAIGKSPPDHNRSSFMLEVLFTVDVDTIFFITLVQLCSDVWSSKPSVMQACDPECCIAIIHIQPYTYTCGNIINNNDERTHCFRKIYLTHVIRNGCERVTKRLWVRGELETEQTATYWPPVPLSLGVHLSRSAGQLNHGSWGSIALCWGLVLSTASYLQLTDSN